MKPILKPIHLYRIAAHMKSILFYIKGLLSYALVISIGSFILCSTTTLNGQSSFQVSQHFTSANGLSSNNVTKVFRDSRGLLWIGTENGLDCYDGQKFTTYNSSANTPIQISNDFINDIAEDSLGRIWVATNNGLNIMDLVKKFNTILSDIDAALFRDKKFIKFASIVKGAAGSMWVCTENNLCEVDTNLTIRVIPSPFLERPRHLTKGKNGLIWGTLRQNIGYFKFDPKKEKVRIYFNYFDKEVMQAIGLSGILGEEYIISNDVKNNIIGFTESSKLLFNLDIEDASIKPFKRGISSSFIGTRLLHLLDPYINEKSTESFNPWCNGILFEAGNQVWVATIRGLFLLKNNNAIRIKKETQLAGLSLRAIYQVNEEEVYIGSYMGLYKWNLTTNKLQIIDPDIFICSFSPYKGDTLLMTSDPNILYLLNKKTDEVSRYQFTNEKEYPSYKIFSILKDDKDALWLGNFKVDIRANQPDSLSFITSVALRKYFLV